MPTFFVLSAFSLLSMYNAVQVVDEVYFNNQRLFLFFNHIMKEMDTGKIDVEKLEILNVKKVNEEEIFYLPDTFNKQKCWHIKCGTQPLQEILKRLHNY